MCAYLRIHEGAGRFGQISSPVGLGRHQLETEEIDPIFQPLETQGQLLELVLSLIAPSHPSSTIGKTSGKRAWSGVGKVRKWWRGDRGV